LNSEQSNITAQLSGFFIGQKEDNQCLLFPEKDQLIDTSRLRSNSTVTQISLGGASKGAILHNDCNDLNKKWE
jgi:hypothetical protein